MGAAQPHPPPVGTVNAALVVGQVHAWVARADGTIDEDSILVTADELGVAINLSSCAAAVTPDNGSELADIVAEAAASSRNLARSAAAGRDRALIEHAERVVADADLGIEYP